MIGRIQRRETFKRLYRRAQSVRSGPIKVSRVTSLPSEPNIAYAFAVPKSTGNAVSRNKSRRRMRHILNDMYHEGGLEPGQYLVSMRPSRPAADFGMLNTNLRLAVEELGKTANV